MDQVLPDYTNSTAGAEELARIKQLLA